MEMTQYKKIEITTEYITLGQMLKFCDVIDSGSLAKSFIMEHSIFVNDEDCKQRGKKLYPGYKISIDDSLFFEIVK